MALDIRLQMALRQPPIIQFENQFVQKRMIDLLSDTYVLLGFKIPKTHELTLLAAKLTSDLYYRTFCKWLKGYKMSDFRYRVIKQMEQRKNVKALPSVSQEYNDECMNRLLIRRFHAYKAQPDSEILLASILYQELQSRGIIRNSLEEKLNAMALFEHWRPQNDRSTSKDYRQSMIKLKAQEWLLKQYFNSVERLPFEKG